MRCKYLIAVIFYLSIQSASFGEGQRPFDVHAQIKNIDSTLQISIQSGQFNTLITNLQLRGIPVNFEQITKYRKVHWYKDKSGETQLIPDVTTEFSCLVKGYNALNILKYYSEPCGYKVDLKNNRLFTSPKEQRLTSESIQVPPLTEPTISFHNLFNKYNKSFHYDRTTINLIDGSRYLLIAGGSTIPKPTGDYEFPIEFQGGSLQDLLWKVLDSLEMKYDDCYFCWQICRIDNDVYIAFAKIEKPRSDELFNIPAP